MEFIDQLTNLYQHDQFFEYHGFALTFLWFVAATMAILLKRANVYLHAMAFFVVDITTIYFIAGAWTRVYPHIDQWDQFSMIKKGHIAGGTLVTLLLLFQHFLGAKAIMTNKHSPIHRKLAWVVTNLARVVAYFGWMFGHYAEKQKMAQYVLIAAIVLFVLSTVSVFSKKNPQRVETQKTPKRD